jgi:hypothetical protein
MEASLREKRDMDSMREQFNKPLVVGIAGLVVGAVFGLVVLGWWLFPVHWINASPENLAPQYQMEWMRMAIDSYSVNGNVALAKARYEAVGPDAPTILAEIAKDPQGQNLSQIAAFGIAVTGTGGAVAPTGAPGTKVAPTSAPGTQVAPTAAPGTKVAPTTGAATQAAVATTAPKPVSSLRTLVGTLLPILCVLVVIVIAAVVVFFLLRNRSAATPKAAPTPAMQAQEAARQAAWTDYQAQGSEPPMAQFMASYKLGDDLFDDSFSIDSPAGEFMGECGVGISETIGVGDPKKVTAFEVWLFDKNDIQTVTKVLMSAHAFTDDTTKQRLSAKGEPIQATPGAETVLETQSLQLVARVVDMGYGEGALPTESFFERFILELAVWPKA